jgi:hypothetical protein
MPKQNGKVVILADVSMSGRGRNRHAHRYDFDVIDERRPVAQVRVYASEAPRAIVDAVDEWFDLDYEVMEAKPLTWKLTEFFALL